MEFAAKRDRLFAEYDRGVLTTTSVEIEFISLMLDASDDVAAVALCQSLPDWFRQHFRQSLISRAEAGYAIRWFAMGDARTHKHVEQDAKRYGQILERLAADILAII